MRTWHVARDGDALLLGVDGAVATVRAARRADDAAAGGTGEVRAPMPGVVLLVPVAPGADVRAGDPLCVLESMKLEVPVLAPADGVVAEVLVAPGDVVARDAPIARLEAP